jgi:hypothetical protein
MTNEEAIFLGVQKWLDNNSEFVGKAITRGVEAAIPEIAAATGIQMSARLGKFMTENKQDFIGVGKEMTSKAIMDVLAERIEARDPNFKFPEKDKKDA